MGTGNHRSDTLPLSASGFQHPNDHLVRETLVRVEVAPRHRLHPPSEDSKRAHPPSHHVVASHCTSRVRIACSVAACSAGSRLENSSAAASHAARSSGSTRWRLLSVTTMPDFE